MPTLVKIGTPEKQKMPLGGSPLFSYPIESPSIVLLAARSSSEKLDVLYTQLLKQQDDIGFSRLDHAFREGYIRCFDLVLKKWPQSETVTVDERLLTLYPLLLKIDDLLIVHGCIPAPHDPVSYQATYAIEAIKYNAVDSLQLVRQTLTHMSQGQKPDLLTLFAHLIKQEFYALLDVLLVLCKQHNLGPNESAWLMGYAVLCNAPKTVLDKISDIMKTADGKERSVSSTPREKKKADIERQVTKPDAKKTPVDNAQMQQKRAFATWLKEGIEKEYKTHIGIEEHSDAVILQSIPLKILPLLKGLLGFIGVEVSVRETTLVLKRVPVHVSLEQIEEQFLEHVVHYSTALRDVIAQLSKAKGASITFDGEYEHKMMLTYSGSHTNISYIQEQLSHYFHLDVTREKPSVGTKETTFVIGVLPKVLHAKDRIHELSQLLSPEQPLKSPENLTCKLSKTEAELPAVAGPDSKIYKIRDPKTSKKNVAPSLTKRLKFAEKEQRMLKDSIQVTALGGELGELKNLQARLKKVQLRIEEIQTQLPHTHSASSKTERHAYDTLNSGKGASKGK